MQMFGKSCLCQATAKTLQLLYTKTIFLMKRFTFVPDFVGLAKTVAFEYNTHAHTHTHARTHAHAHTHTHTHTHAHTHALTHTHTHSRTRASAHTHIHRE